MDTPNQAPGGSLPNREERETSRFGSRSFCSIWMLAANLDSCGDILAGLFIGIVGLV